VDLPAWQSPSPGPEEGSVSRRPTVAARLGSSWRPRAATRWAKRR
jgi:hypothetical protein